VVDAAPPGGGDSGQIQELLAAAEGYAVFGREGKRLGALIGLAGSGDKHISIRHDGTFLWRRRLLPITTVASVFPRQRAVVLNVDSHSLASKAIPDEAAVKTPFPPEGSADSSEDVQRRISRYLSSGQWETDQANHDHADAAHQPSVESAAPEHPLPGPTPQPHSEHEVASAEHSAPYLVFVSSPRGYVLVELEGPPPGLGEEIELPEQPGPSQVTRLGPSPLPNDPRICAYLLHTPGELLGAETADRV
jgi:hypothetical protein